MTGIDSMSDAATFVLGWLAIVAGLLFGMAAIAASMGALAI